MQKKEIKNIHLDSVQKITVEKNHNFIANSFLAHNCGPCKIMEPDFEKASKELKNVKFGKVNVDGNQDIAMRFQVMSIPTTIFFKEKEQVDRVSGALSFSDIKKRAEDNFK